MMCNIQTATGGELGLGDDVQYTDSKGRRVGGCWMMCNIQTATGGELGLLDDVQCTDSNGPRAGYCMRASAVTTRSLSVMHQTIRQHT